MVIMTTDETRKVVDDLVNTFKREGKFDKLRKDTLAKVLANDSFALIAEETNQIADNILKSLSDHETKDKVRMTIREQLNVNLQQKIETAVFKVMGTDDNIQLILDEVGVPISRYLGLNGDEDSKQNGCTQKDENHQVCDMEIESDSDKGADYSSKNSKSRSGVYIDNQKTGHEKLRREQEPLHMSKHAFPEKEAKQERDKSMNANELNSGCSLNDVKLNQAGSYDGNGMFRMHTFGKKKKSSISSQVSTEFVEDSLRRQRKQRRDPDFAYFN